MSAELKMCEKTHDSRWTDMKRKLNPISQPRNTRESPQNSITSDKTYHQGTRQEKLEPAPGMSCETWHIQSWEKESFDAFNKFFGFLQKFESISR